MAREDEIAQGLREPGGALIGGLHVLDYIQGRDDFIAGNPPLSFSSTSYDLGRVRAAEEREQQEAFKQQMRDAAKRSDAIMADILKDRPDLLADYRKRIADIRSGAA